MTAPAPTVKQRQALRDMMRELRGKSSGLPGIVASVAAMAEAGANAAHEWQALPGAIDAERDRMRALAARFREIALTLGDALGKDEAAPVYSGLDGEPQAEFKNRGAK